MPDLPQTMALPKETQPWSHRLTQAWTLMIQTLNDLSRTGLAADKTTTPNLNHSLYTESDGEQRSYVAVDGVWVGIRPTLRIVATASLPAAGASMNGTVLIENVAAGDQNLIVYANGERYRIDGGASF